MPALHLQVLVQAECPRVRPTQLCRARWWRRRLLVTEGEAVPAPPEPDFRSAEANQRKLVASRALRNAVVAACAGRSVDMVVDLNDKEEKVVFEVARKRYDGALQTDMAKLIGVTPANFFNIAKALEARGLLVRTKARAEFASAGAGAGHLRSRTGLHIVAHLKRFAPSSGNTQALSQTDAWESVEMEDDTTLVLKALGAANVRTPLCVHPDFLREERLQLRACTQPT